VSFSAHGHSTCIPICTLYKFHRKHNTPEEGTGVAAMFSLIQATCHALPNPINNPRCDFKVAMLITRFRAGFSGFRKASQFNAAPPEFASNLRKQFVDDRCVRPGRFFSTFKERE
jgi:hypothetical protein